jgi:hypothetical protein
MNSLEVRLTNVVVEHEVRLTGFTKWLDRNGGSPEEMNDRTRIRSIPGMEKSKSERGKEIRPPCGKWQSYRAATTGSARAPGVLKAGVESQTTIFLGRWFRRIL